MKRSPVIAAVATLLALQSAVAQNIGLLPESQSTRIDRVFSRFNQQTPGCALGVAQGGKPVYARGYGMANLEYSVPFTPATVSETGSVAKQFTATAVLLLARDGKLSLDDDIRKHIPELADFGHRITIRHMLSHTSGMRDQFGLLDFSGRGMGTFVFDVDDVYQLAIRQKALNFAPGEEYLYSNTPFTLMNVLVSRISGMPFAKFSEERIFKPLGMTNTRWRDDHTRLVPGRAYAYAPEGNTFHMAMPMQNIHGSGGLLTTVGDLLIWNQNLDRPGADWKTITEQLQTRTRLASGTEIDYGLGLGVSTFRGVREISHGGSTAGYRTWLGRFPDQQLSIALLCNVSSAAAESLGNQVAETLLGNALKAEPAPKPAISLPASDLQRIAGLYRDPRTDAVLYLRMQDDNLMLGRAPAGAALTPIASGRFRNAAGTVEYIIASPGKLEVRPASGAVTLYEAAAPPAAATAAQLQQFAGRYISAELGSVYEAAIDDKGRLTLRYMFEPAMPLEPTYADAFTGGGILFRFTRDAAGRVNGFEVNAGRVRHLRFDRQ